MIVRAVVLVPWFVIGAVEVQKLVACGEGAGEGVDDENVSVADDGHEEVDGVRSYGANEKGLTCSHQAQTKNHEVLLLVAEYGETGDVRTSDVVVVACDDQQCSRHLYRLYQKALSLPDYLSWIEISLACLVVKQNFDSTGFGFAEPLVHNEPPYFGTAAGVEVEKPVAECLLLQSH